MSDPDGAWRMRGWREWKEIASRRLHGRGRLRRSGRGWARARRGWETDGIEARGIENETEKGMEGHAGKGL
eukprot:2924460-Rhodomonas_salina.1